MGVGEEIKIGGGGSVQKSRNIGMGGWKKIEIGVGESVEKSKYGDGGFRGKNEMGA